MLPPQPKVAWDLPLASLSPQDFLSGHTCFKGESILAKEIKRA
jgi:hypothetical protein